MTNYLTNRQLRKLKRRILQNFESIYTVSKEACDSYGLHSIPIVSLKIIIEKFKVTPYGSPQQLDLFIKVNDVLDEILATSHRKAKSLKSDAVPLNFLRHSIDVVKNGFSLGSLNIKEDQSN